MKKLFPLMALLVVLLSACRYEEPVVNFQKPENRLIGTWVLDKSFQNGVEQKEFNSNYMNRPGSYYYFFYHGEFAVQAYAEGIPQQSVKGSWIFFENKKKIEINFVFWNKKYIYDAEIIKLSNKELKYRYKDENGNTWQLEMFKRSS